MTVKLLFFPPGHNTSFKSMSRMKKVQPEMERLKKLHAEDPQKQQMEIMALYKRKERSIRWPAGLAPMLICRFRVFFSLYKVLYVTIEMRHAPFYGWVHDLSAPDPTSILNLFGLLPYNPGAIPAGLSPGHPVHRRLADPDGHDPVPCRPSSTPAPADPVRKAKMFALMPLIFTFMFATFPAGLVIYCIPGTIFSPSPLSNGSSCTKEGVRGAPVSRTSSLKAKEQRK